MDKKLYYAFMATLGDKQNCHGFVVNGQVPFLSAPQAVAYVMQEFPELTPKDHPLEYNPVRCRELAAPLYTELVMLEQFVDKMREEAYGNTARLIKERDEIEVKDILGEVHREVKQKEVLRAIGRASGLSDAWQYLYGRKYELWQCSRLKEA